MPNQLVQKPQKENKNLCKFCLKNDVCEDYRRMKYVEVCDSYCTSFDTKSECPRCKNKTTTWVLTNSEGTILECNLCHTKFYRGRGIIVEKANGDLCGRCLYANACKFVGSEKLRCECKEFKSIIELETKKCPLCNVEMVVEASLTNQIVYRCKSCNYKVLISRSLDLIKDETKYSEVQSKKVEIKLTVTHGLLDELKAQNFEKGIKTYNNLKLEYDNVIALFKDNPQTKLIDVLKIKKTADDIYDKSLKFLSLALELHKQLGVTSYDNLKSETEELQGNLENCKDENSALYKTLKEAIERNDKILTLMKKNKDRIDELFGQISLCKDAIMEIRLGLPELLHHQSQDELDSVITESKERLSFGQRLLEEYKVQGL